MNGQIKEETRHCWNMVDAIREIVYGYGPLYDKGNKDSAMPAWLMPLQEGALGTLSCFNDTAPMEWAPSDLGGAESKNPLPDTRV